MRAQDFEAVRATSTAPRQDKKELPISSIALLISPIHCESLHVNAAPSRRLFQEPAQPVAETMQELLITN